MSKKECDFCGEPIAHRIRKDRCKHHFCSRECSAQFQASKRDDDCCKRCGRNRRETWYPFFTRGYCNKCYGLLLAYGFDEHLAAAHETNVRLKQEIQNAKDRNQKHGRPAAHAH